MQEYRFAIIGCGKIAPRHAEQISRIGKLIAVCDIIPEKAEKLAKDYDARVYYSIEDLLENESGQIDIVSICTPNGLHPIHSISALNKGFHVLCEKPLAISTKEAEQMISTAKKTGKNLFVVKSTRYNPSVELLKKLLDEGRLGKLYSFQLSCFWNRPVAYYKDSWRGTVDMDGGTLFTQFSHYIDVLYWLLGEVKSCHTLRKNLAHQGVIQFEDSGVVALEMQDGPIGTINYSVNAYTKNMEVSLTLIAEKGTIKIGGEYLNHITYHDIADFTLPDLAEGNEANTYGFYKGSMGNHRQVYDNLLKAIEDPDHPFTDAEVGLKTVEIIQKIYSTPVS